MEWTLAILKEVWSLFVDDGAFALSILIWLAMTWLLSSVGLPSALACIVFFAGFAALLLQSTLTRAKKP